MTSPTVGVKAVGTGTNNKVKQEVTNNKVKQEVTNNKVKQEVKNSTCAPTTTEGGLLEVDPSLKSKTAELASIIKQTNDVNAMSLGERTSELANKKELHPSLSEEGPPPSSDCFVDDLDVPPLI